MTDRHTAPDPATEPMRVDVHRQPGIWRALADRAEEIAAFARESLAPGPGGRTFVFGSGDGWFAARAAAGPALSPAWTALGGLPFLVEAAPTLAAHDRVVAISMSGSVDRTVDATRAALASGARVSILTNADGGRLGGLTDRAFRLGLSDIAPFLCGTSSYTATLCVLMGARAVLTGDTGFPGRLKGLADALEASLPAMEQWADDVAQGCGAAPSGARFLAVGRDLATADYGAAKLVELSLIRPWSDDIEEFAHRQYWTTAPDEMAVFLPGSATVAGFASASAEALSELGLATVAIEPAGCPVPGARHRVGIAASPEDAPLLQAVALQCLAYRLAQLSGTNPNRRLHLKDDTLRFSVSRKLTRRSLLGTGR